MKKILLFVDKISSSGASKIITWLANNLEIEETITYLVTYLPVEDQREISPNIQRLNFEVYSNNRIIRSSIIIKKLRKVFIQEKIDVCIAFLPMESMYALLAATGISTKVVVCERSDPYLEKNVVVEMARFLFRFADGAVFQTEGAKKYFPTHLQTRSVVIPNPAFKREHEQFVPYFERPKIIAYSGRLYIKQKRQDILLKAFKILIDNGHEITLHIYGDGPDRRSLEEMAQELRIKEYIEFHGNVNNIEERISNSRMLVLTSDYEGIPNVIIEALQCGVPVVATDCSPGGAKLLIHNGENGFVVPREDYQALSERMEYLINNIEKSTDMAENAVNITKIFDEKIILTKWRNYILDYCI